MKNTLQSWLIRYFFPILFWYYYIYLYKKNGKTFIIYNKKDNNLGLQLPLIMVIIISRPTGMAN